MCKTWGKINCNIIFLFFQFFLSCLYLFFYSNVGEQEHVVQNKILFVLRLSFSYSIINLNTDNRFCNRILIIFDYKYAVLIPNYIYHILGLESCIKNRYTIIKMPLFNSSSKEYPYCFLYMALLQNNKQI